MINKIKEVIHEDKITTYSTYTIGKKTYKVTFTSNTPSDDALRNFAKEFLKQN